MGPDSRRAERSNNTEGLEIVQSLDDSQEQAVELPAFERAPEIHTAITAFLGLGGVFWQA